MPTTQPNLFQYGPSELSQDAFLAWLVAWARPQHAGEALHEAAKDFILHLHGLAAGAILAPPPDQQAPVVSGDPAFVWLGGPYLQLDKIDLCFEVQLGGVPHLFLIEDKTHSGAHGDQLANYSFAAQKRFSGHHIVRVFYKTGLITDDLAHAEEKNGYRALTLDAAVALLEQLRARYSIAHDVFLNYLAHIQQQSTERKAWSLSFNAKPQWAWLSDNPESVQDLMDEATATGAKAWPIGQHPHALAKARRRAIQLQWEFLTGLKAKLEAQGPHGNCLRLYRGNSRGRPWTQLAFWVANPTDGEPPGEALFYRLDWDKNGTYLDVRHYHRAVTPEQRPQKVLAGKALEQAWKAADQLNGKDRLFLDPGNHGTYEREIAHLSLKDWAGQADVEALLDQVAAVHRSFAQGLPPRAPLALLAEARP